VIPAHFQVVVTHRPKYACRACEQAVVQVPAPERLIKGGRPRRWWRDRGDARDAQRDALASGKIAVDESVAPVLDPGRGRTKASASLKNNKRNQGGAVRKQCKIR
jgi:hypothetical protein